MSSVALWYMLFAGLLRSRRNLERLRSAPRSARRLWRQHVSISWMCSEAAADQTKPPASRRRSAPSPVIHRRARCAISDLDRKLGAQLGANRKWKYLETILKIYWKRVKTSEPKSRWKKSKKAVPSLAIAPRSWDIVPDHGSKHTNFSGSPLRQTTLWNTQVWRM